MIERRPDSRTSPRHCDSLVHLLRRRRQLAPDQLAYQFLVDGQREGARLTYRQLDEQAQAIAIGLRQVACPGDRALLLYPPGHEFLLAFFGCLQAGIIAVPLPPPDAARIKRALPRIQSVIRDANASLVLTTDSISQLLRSHFDAENFHDLSWINTESIHSGQTNDSVDNDDSVDDNVEPWQPSADHIAFLQYTSGSTSSPKGVMVSHGNVIAQCRSLTAAAGYNERSVTCTWMPYHHDYGLIEGLIQPLFVGAPCYFLSPLAFIKRPHRWLEAISKYRVTHSQAPNFAYDLCVRKVTDKQRSNLDLSSWAVAAIGAEPIRIQTLESFFQAYRQYGLRWQSLAPAYGLAEATLVVSHATPGEGPTVMQADLEAYGRGRLVAADSNAGNGQRTWPLISCGRVLKDSQVEIVNDQTGHRCGEGEVGEIWVTGTSITQGYWNRPEETEHSFHATIADSNQGPFLRTGDLGCLLDGQLYVTGRVKDLIIIRGLNHYPQDIELTVEASHPAIRVGNGAAFSVDVDGEEELVVVYEVQGKQLRDLDSKAVLSAIREAVFQEHDLQLHAIALWKPGGVPKTTSGKIQRRAVKAAFLAGDVDAVVTWQAATVEMANDLPLSDRTTPTNESIRQWITRWLADKNAAAAATIGPTTKFAELGVDSLRAADLASDLEQWLGEPVDATIFWQATTIEALAGHFADQPVPSDPPSRAAELTNQKVDTVGPTVTTSPTNVNDSTMRSSSIAVDTIAIIGMGCRFPGGVCSPESYWRLLRDGSDAIGEIPADRWDVDAYYDPNREAAGKMYVRHGGFVENIDGFDASFFGITPREVEQLDPQQRLLLEVVWESLNDAGIAPGCLRGSNTGVFVGQSSDDYAASQRQDHGLEALDAYKILGTARSFAAGRVAYLLGLHGPAIQLDTACSSSLVSVYQACQSLQASECDLAMAGGVNLMLSPATMISLCKLTALAADGKGKTFDAAADGYVRGEGCGMVVLKRMEDAIRDGDKILATICSAAVNHDGASNGLTAPSGQAQEMLLRNALRKANLQGRQVSYVEAHGTGTELGDPIELSAINTAYNTNQSRSEPLYVGSVKSNIGHLEAAAGIAGLIKIVLMVQHREIPPQLNYQTPNPHVAWDSMPLKVATGLLPWPDADRQGLAAVSSFGFSGTNAHVVIAAADPSSPNGKSTTGERSSRDADASLPPLHLLPLSANSEASLKLLAAKYIDHLVAHPEQSIEDICFTAATCRDHYQHRLAVIASSCQELLTRLRDFVSGDDLSLIVRGTGPVNGQSARQRVGFLFTGQGTQYVGMGRDLYESQPIFRQAIHRCSQWLENRLDLPLTELLYSESAAEHSRLDRTLYTQPVLFALQYALVELWKSWGVEPAAVIGHSLGEYAAAAVAGVIDPEAGLELVVQRGRLIEGLPETGTMAVVMADEARVLAAIEPFADQVSIAAINAPEIIVISGRREAMAQTLANLCDQGIDVEMLKTSNAGHSSLVDPMLEPFAAVADSLQYSPPRIDMISNVSGTLAGDEIACGQYWVRHVRQPVRFADGMRALAETPCTAFVEIGPNPNLLAMGMACVKGRRPRPRWLPTLTKGRSAWETILYSLGELYCSGANIDWASFHRPYQRHRVALPTYAFDRQRFPLRSKQPPTASSNNGAVDRPRRSQLPAPPLVAQSMDHLRHGLEDESRSLTLPLDEAAIRFIINALQQLGFPWYVGAEFEERRVKEKLPALNHPKVTRVLSRLVQRGLLDYERGLYRVKTTLPDGDAADVLDTLQSKAEYPECELMRRAGRSLASIWLGKVEPLSILFPNGGTDQAVAFYRHARLLAKYNELAAEAVRTAVASLSKDASLRVLEVGGGTGGLTTFLLPQMPAERCEYVFTDLSPLFLHAAQDRFQHFPFLTTKLLDIGKQPQQQGFAAGSFDLVVAANVLHATPRLHDTLTYVRQLLKPGGWLMLLEGANPPLWGDMVFTLMDGWWNFEDTQLRPDYPLMRRDRWTSLLHETQFEEIAYLNDAKSKDDSYNTLYLARTTTAEMPAWKTTDLDGAAPRSPELVPEENIAETGALIASPPTNDPQSDRLGNSLIDIFDLQALTEMVREHAARVMRMRTAEIERTQPLSELGLDSLMATELRAQLGKTFGRELSLNTLQMRRSVEEIASYIHENRVDENTVEQASKGSGRPDLDVNAPRAHLIPLQPKGSKTPLFFIPAGYGDLFAFQQISYAIGMSQPVYGLQPASANRVKTFRQMSVYRLVSAYISEIKKVQPEGPYYLSGYSAGAIIAVELARELKRQGQEVGLLVIFDPPSHVPFWLDVFYAVNYRLTVASGLIDLVSRLNSNFVRRLFHTMLDEGLRTHTSVTREHRVAPYPGRITHFRARLSQSSLVSMKPVGWFWRKTAQVGIEVHWIPGTHYGMLRGSGAGVVVDELRDCLQRATSSHPKKA